MQFHLFCSHPSHWASFRFSAARKEMFQFIIIPAVVCVIALAGDPNSPHILNADSILLAESSLYADETVQAELPVASTVPAAYAITILESPVVLWSGSLPVRLPASDESSSRWCSLPSLNRHQVFVGLLIIMAGVISYLHKSLLGALIIYAVAPTACCIAAKCTSSRSSQADQHLSE